MDIALRSGLRQNPFGILSEPDQLRREPRSESSFADAQANALRPIPPLRQIIDEHGVQVWRTLHHCGVPEADLQDVCQEVFLVIDRKIGEFEGRSSLRTWVYQICLRVASDHRKRARFRHERIVADPPELVVLPTQSQDIDDARTLERLFAILDRLDPHKREVFVLYEMEEQSMTEIAEAVGCPLRTAYSRLEAARKEITRAWGRDQARWRRP